MNLEPNINCPCGYGDPCGENCSCSCPILSGGCLRCCTGGSDDQRKASAKRIIVNENNQNELLIKSKGLIKRLDELKSSIDSAFIFASVHGMKHEGGNYAQEKTDLENIIERIKQ